ncbi:cell wall-binding repeat-containing protein [Caloramator sp. mosi_1]|uniref:cell wall-binding repeat-containing protein n=1 Tax=Caloramator sp. mosi_1 TaxID=3023090 RepID=UPI002362E777|nr:cell wall-binding repeat-containing protein [Caloramator sp. mosi_1]WDC84986.1 cell wall-binding repeat-containing protein [Caloramator sp. mosi_1]
MNDKVKRVLSTLTLSALVATNAAVLMPRVASAAEAEVKSLAGANRYETADKINAELGTKFDKVILTSGEQANLVDALAAAPLAKKLGAPVVIIDHKTAKAADVVAKINGLGAKEVYVVSGPQVISAEVKDALRSAGMTVKELGGKDRYETAYNIAKELGSADTAVVVNGVTGLADAMSIAPVAAAKGWPIILASKDDVNDTYKGNYNKYYVIGGENALSASVLNEVKNGERIYGADRYATNLEIVKNSRMK